MTPIKLLLALVMATAGLGPLKAYQKMGPEECHGETCLPGQYCSDAAMHEGCRNCTHLNPWCPDVAYLEKHFPQCAYVCELKDAQEKIATLQAEVKTLTNEKQSLNQNLTQATSAALLTKRTLQEREGDLNDTLKTLTKALDNNANLKKVIENERNRSMASEKKYLQETEALEVIRSKLEECDQRLKDAENQNTVQTYGFAGAVFVLFVIIVVVVVYLCGVKRDNKVLAEKIVNRGTEPVSTASSTSGRLCRLCFCRLWTKGTAPTVRYVAQPDADPTFSPMLPHTISSPGNDDGTDSGNNTGSNSADSSQQNIMVAPNGLRTEHEKNDAEDFMIGPYNV